MHTYYRDPQPERVLPLVVRQQEAFERIDDPDQAGKLTHFIIGWTAAAMMRHPQCIDVWEEAWTARYGREPHVMALYFSGRSEAALVMADRVGATATTRAWLIEQPAALLPARPRDTYAMDRLWGAALASGNPDYLVPIIDVLVSRIREDEVDVGGVYAMAFGGEGAEAAEAAVRRQSSEMVLDHELAAHAWYLLSYYAREHAFVREALRAARRTDPDSPGAKLLTASLRWARVGLEREEDAPPPLEPGEIDPLGEVPDDAAPPGGIKA